jgi:hypothetical protein
MRRDVARFKARRNSVVNRRMFGKDVNLTGSSAYIEANSTTTDIIRFRLIKMSSKNEGSGMSRTSRITTAAIGTVR